MERKKIFPSRESYLTSRAVQDQKFDSVGGVRYVNQLASHLHRRLSTLTGRSHPPPHPGSCCNFLGKLCQRWGIVGQPLSFPPPSPRPPPTLSSAHLLLSFWNWVGDGNVFEDVQQILDSWWVLEYWMEHIYIAAPPPKLTWEWFLITTPLQTLRSKTNVL